MVAYNQTIIKRLRVSDLTRYLRQLIESDEILIDVWVQGEVSNVSTPASGHTYFTLKDSDSSLKCVVWRSKAHKINIAIKNGMAVEVHGSITIYEAGGQYQLNSDNIRHRGEGYLFSEYLRLKSLLEKEGLFDQNTKKLIPQVVKKIGIVTSPTGAAIQDMIDTIQRRNPMVEIILAGSSVQGDSAPAELVSSLKQMEEFDSIDLILIARGGGSIEDLWAFNNEQFVRAISNSSIPIITGIGHETDFTLSDFAADLRAPTPTAAAELATIITLTNLQDQLTNLIDSMNALIDDFLDHKIVSLQFDKRRLLDNSPIRLINGYWQGLDGVSTRMKMIQRNRLILVNTKLENTKGRFLALNPFEILKRGYAIITNKEGSKIVKSVKKLTLGDELIVKVQDGKFGVNVNSMENAE